MERRSSVFIVCMFLMASLGHTTAQSEEVSTIGAASTTTSAPLKSAEEFWDFLEMLCEVQPTRRCESDQMARVRRGEIIPVPYYDTERAYRTREEIYESLIKNTTPGG